MIKYYTILKITFLTVFTDVGKYAIVLRNCKSSTIINLYNYMQHVNICIKEWKDICQNVTYTFL